MNLLIDGNNLAHREAYSKANLSHNCKPTGAILGVLQRTMILTAMYPGEVFFCWDGRESHRREWCPSYKANRLYDNGIPVAKQAVFDQMDDLRNDILPRIGFPNQVTQEGYEADDLIAALCRRPGFHVIVSSDNDLWQCLSRTVRIYLLGKRRELTYDSFWTEYGIRPQDWIYVKALMGDSGDNIQGIPGIGIKTAIKCVAASPDEKLSSKIQSHAKMIDRNIKLIRLPWEGADPGPTKKSQFNSDQFHLVCEKYGLRSLM